MQTMLSSHIQQLQIGFPKPLGKFFGLNAM